jgi:hypothetical protein
VSHAKYMISYQSRFRMIWDLILISFSILNCIVIPLDVAWNTAYQETIGYFCLYYGFAFIFFFDIVVNFRTSFVNKFGEEIHDPTIIAMHYVLSINFIFDIVCIS